MSDSTTFSFIESTLTNLSNEYDIPEDMIPQLIGLLKNFPDSSIYGAKKGLLEGLEQQINNIKNKGDLG